MKGNSQFDVIKTQEGFSIYSEKENTFDWHVRKIRKGFKDSRWLKDNKHFNPQTYRQDEMNTFESYIEQDVWSK